MTASAEAPEVDKPSFVRIMLGDYAKRIRIPIVFSENITKKLQDRATLRITNLRRWQVEVKKDGASKCFLNGWSEFAKDTLLQLADFLSFTYDGQFTFDVTIYGKDGRAKEVPVQIHEELLFPTEDHQKGKDKKANHPGPCGCMYKQAKSIGRAKDSNTETRWVFKVQKHCPFKLQNPHYTATYKSSRTNDIRLQKRFIAESGIGKEGMRPKVILIDPRGELWQMYMTQGGEGRWNFGNKWREFGMDNNLLPGDICVFELIDSNGPYTLQVHIFRKGEKIGSHQQSRQFVFFGGSSMTSSNHEVVGCKPSFFKVLIGEFREKLRIPTSFYEEFEGKLLDRSTLRCADGKSWHVRVQKIGDSWYFMEGWSELVDMYGLHTEEYVIFHYDGMTNFDIKMYGKNGCDKRIGMNQCQIRKSYPRSVSFCQCRFKLRPHSSQLTGNEDKGVFAADSLCPLRVKNPHFSTKYLTCFTRQLPIPLHFGTHTGLTGHKASLQSVLLDPLERPWLVNMAKKGIGRLCFGLGWSNFVTGNEIVPGDTCVFELSKSRGRSSHIQNVFRVHIVRGSKEGWEEGKGEREGKRGKGREEREEGKAERREEGKAERREEGKAERREEGKAVRREEGKAERREEGKAERREEGKAERREEGGKGRGGKRGKGPCK